MYVDRKELARYYLAVSKALDARPLESLHDAAMRTFRQNCAPEVTLDVARIVLRCAGASSDEQWRLLKQAHERLEASAPSN